jgi:hypothetical protein
MYSKLQILDFKNMLIKEGKRGKKTGKWKRKEYNKFMGIFTKAKGNYQRIAEGENLTFEGEGSLTFGP